MNCNGNLFKTIRSEEVAVGISSPTLGIDEEDCLGVVLQKLIIKVEALWKNQCNSEISGNSIDPAIPSKEVVDYSLSPVLKVTKGSRGNTIESDWTGLEAIPKGEDEIVRKSTEIYTNNGTRLVSSSNKDQNIFDIKPNDYPLNVVMKAYVNTKNAGMVVSEKIIPVSGDFEGELNPLLEIKKNADIQDPSIAMLNAEVNKLRELLDKKADK